MYYNRFDIIDAYYWFCVDYHNGQFSELYKRQCKISTYFKPSTLLNGPYTDNAREIYNELVSNYNAARSDKRYYETID